MFSNEEYKKLKDTYGAYSSWAIWNDNNSRDTEVIDDHMSELNTDYVFVGLNISRALGNSAWSNFHDNTHARKLRYACNNSKLRGCYITDLFKDLPEANSSKLKNVLTEEVISKNVVFFKQEMTDIHLTNRSIFVILGSLTTKYFDTYFKKNFTNAIIYYDHYSAYAKYSDQKWVEGLWNKLEIQENVDPFIN